MHRCRNDTDAASYAATLRFDGTPIERTLRAPASGLLPDVVTVLLDEMKQPPYSR